MSLSGNHNSNAASTMTYIGIGSNLNQPIQQVLTALKSLAKLPNSRLLAQSSLYRSHALKVPKVADTGSAEPNPIDTGLIGTRAIESDQAIESPAAAQNDYINAVAKLETRLPAEQLLLALQAIEQSHGRIRKQRWEPRPLDLDILLYGDQTIATDTLNVPHPEISKRHFVLYPLAEIAPELIMPYDISLADLLKRCPIDELAIVELASETTSNTAPSAGE